MASLTLNHVTVDFQVYGPSPTFRQQFARQAIGGLIRRSASSTSGPVIRGLDGVNLEIRHGDRVGLVGHNGAGKSTLLRVLAGIYEPTGGTCRVEGRVSSLFVTAPGLSLADTGFENIITCGLLLGMSKQEVRMKMPEIAEFTELGDYLSLPVQTYSQGMKTRLAFAIATALDPEILLLDEGLSAGDERFTERAQHRVEALAGRANVMVLASHSVELLGRMCNRIVKLEHGRVIADGTPAELLHSHSRPGA